MNSALSVLFIIVADPGSGFSALPAVEIRNPSQLPLGHVALPTVEIRKSSQPPSGFTTADGVTSDLTGFRNL